jgi:hypothetical protein
MIPIKENFSKGGFDYQLIDRKEDVCIYAQSDEGKLIAFEVFKVNQNPDREMFGKAYEASESVPPTTQWGSNAFTVHTIEQALLKQAVIINHIKELSKVAEFTQAGTI